MERENHAGLLNPQERPELFEKVGIASEQIDTAWVERIGFWSIVWQQFKKNRLAMIGLYCLAMLVAIAVYAPVLSLNAPFFCYFAGESPEEFDRLDHDEKREKGFILKQEFAQTAGADGKVSWERFKELDVNQDGKVSEWEWKGSIRFPDSFPWIVALFDRTSTKNGVDIFFNLLMMLSPLYILAWFIVQRRLGKAMSLHFLQVVFCFFIVHLWLFTWVLHRGDTGSPLSFHLAMLGIPIYLLLLLFHAVHSRLQEQRKVFFPLAAGALLAVHLMLYVWGLLATLPFEPRQIAAGEKTPFGTGYYCKLFQGGHYGKPDTYYQESQRKISREIAVVRNQHQDPVSAVAWGPDGRTIASGASPMEQRSEAEQMQRKLTEIEDDTTVQLWDVEEAQRIAILAGHEKGVRSIAFSPDGSTLASAAADGTVRLWNIARAMQIAVFEHPDEVLSVSWKPDGKTFASGAKDSKIRLWDAAGGKPIVISGHEGPVTCVAWNVDAVLASASRDKTIRLWDQSGNQLGVLAGHSAPVTNIAWSPDGKRIASASADNTVRLWDAENGKEIAQFTGHKKTVTSVAWAPDGSRFASASLDKTIRLWSTAGELAVLPDYTKFGHTRGVTSISFNPDGKILASASEDLSVRLWDVRENYPEVSYLYPLRCYHFSETDTTEGNPRPPGDKFLLGTIADGKDLLAIMIYGTRISLTIGIVAVSIYVAIGIILGAIAGFSGGKVDIIISRFIEIMLCFPTLFLILTMVAIIDKPSIFHIMVVIGVTGWTTVARLVRAEFLRLRNIEYVQAAVAQGLDKSRVIFGHVLPNALGPVLVAATFGVAAAILYESTLAFLGLGDASAPSWGTVLNQGYKYYKMWLILTPGFAIFFVVSVLNLVGEGLRDALDPKLRQ